MRQTALVLSVYAAFRSILRAVSVRLVFVAFCTPNDVLSVVRSEDSQKPSNRVIIGT